MEHRTAVFGSRRLCTSSMLPGCPGRTARVLAGILVVAFAAVSEEQQDDFFAAVQSQDTDEVEVHLSDGSFDVNVRDADGSTALHLASFTGDHSTVSLLILKQARMDLVADHGGTALHVAVMGNQTRVATALLRAGASIDAETWCMSSKTCDSGITPLMAATMQGHAPMVKLLLDAGADVLKRVPKRGDALDAAEHAGFANIAKLLRRTIKKGGLETKRERSRMDDEIAAASTDPRKDPQVRAQVDALKRKAAAARARAAGVDENSEGQTPPPPSSPSPPRPAPSKSPRRKRGSPERADEDDWEKQWEMEDAIESDTDERAQEFAEEHARTSGGYAKQGQLSWDWENAMNEFARSMEEEDKERRTSGKPQTWENQHVREDEMSDEFVRDKKRHQRSRDPFSKNAMNEYVRSIDKEDRSNVKDEV